MVKRIRSMYSHKPISVLAVIMMMSVLLQGCLYPNELRKENQASAREGILLVQNAVDEYQKTTGLLPLVNAGPETPRYEKFEINFKLLTSSALLSSVPANAFESGGNDLYLILNEETDPIVRVADLATAQHVNDLQRSIDVIKLEYEDIPRGDMLYPGFYEIPYSSINVRKADVKSPYSGESLTFMMDEHGSVYADYGPDIMQAIERSEDSEHAKQSADLRGVLVEEGLYVPIKSVPYVWKENAPWPQP